MIDFYTLNGLGGLSGLSFVEENSEQITFWTLTDRGPNAEEIKTKDPKIVLRPFLKPEYRPKVIKFSVNKTSKEVTILKEIELGLSGLPNLESHEFPVDRFGKTIPKDLHGIDPESICFSRDNIWIGEEYGPSILKFSLEGKLIKRFVPVNSYPEDSGFVQELPSQIKSRKLNRGFEGLACDGDKVYAVLQSPLPADGKNVLIFEFNIHTEKVERSFYYPLDSLKADKIGDLDFRNGKFYIIEQNSQVGPESFHRVYEFELSSADMNGLLTKKLRADLTKLGFDFADKLEGLAVMPDGRLSVVNDNDFGLSGKWSDKSGEAPLDPDKKSVLGIIP